MKDKLEFSRREKSGRGWTAVMVKVLQEEGDVEGEML